MSVTFYLDVITRATYFANNSCVCVCVEVHDCVCTYKCVCVCAHAHVHAFVCVCAYTYVFEHTEAYMWYCHNDPYSLR